MHKDELNQKLVACCCLCWFCQGSHQETESRSLSHRVHMETVHVYEADVYQYSPKLQKRTSVDSNCAISRLMCVTCVSCVSPILCVFGSVLFLFVLFLFFLFPRLHLIKNTQ